MKVYIVTAGSYSDYHIEAVFTDPEKANKYKNLDSDREVEEYEADSVSVEYSCKLDHPNVYSVFYDYKKGKVTCLSLTFLRSDDDGKLKMSGFGPEFQFFVPDSERLWKDITEYGKDSPLLKKIAEDMLAEYLYEHGLCRKELLDRLGKEKKEQCARYTMYQTSGEIKLLTQRIKDGKPLPPVEELQTLYDITVEEVKKEHGEA